LRTRIDRLPEISAKPLEEPVSLNDYLQNMGQKVQEIRRDLGGNQQQLADSADLDRTYISAVEHGKQNLTLGAIVKLADGLGVELKQLLSQRDRR
jgi:transcriptional regulator with XRE-family HTH domain